MNATAIVAKTRKKYNTISKMAHCNLKTGFRYVIAARKKYRKNKNKNEKYIYWLDSSNLLSLSVLFL